MTSNAVAQTVPFASRARLNVLLSDEKIPHYNEFHKA